MSSYYKRTRYGDAKVGSYANNLMGGRRPQFKKYVPKSLPSRLPFSKAGSGRLANMVRKEIHRQAEKKFCNRVQSNITLTASSNVVLPFIHEVVPDITQGTNFGTRIGDKISVERLTLNYNIVNDPDTAPTDAFIVKMYLVTVKLTPSTTPVQADFNQLLLSAPGASAPFTSTTGLTDMLYPVNYGYFKIHKQWEHKIGASVPVSTGAPAEYNNDFGIFARGTVDCTSYVSKSFTFNQNVTDAIGSNVYLLACVTSVDQTVANPPLISVSSNLFFSDL